jgi:hypothetical protein
MSKRYVKHVYMVNGLALYLYIFLHENCMEVSGQLDHRVNLSYQTSGRDAKFQTPSCQSLGCYPSDSHGGGPVSISDHVLWDCDGQSDTEAGTLRVLRFPLPILTPPNGPYSSIIIRGW